MLSLRNQDEIRVARLHDYNILDTPPELDFDELVRLIYQICEVPIAMISLVDKGRQWFKRPRRVNPRDRTVPLVLHPNDTTARG